MGTFWGYLGGHIGAAVGITKDKDQQNFFGNTALISAAQNGRVEVVQFLLEAGADKDLKERSGKTALMCAAERGRAAIVQLLEASENEG